MLRTNSKQVRQKVQKFIFENCVPHENITFPGVACTALYIKDTFYNEFLKYDNSWTIRYGCVSNAMVEWLRGLPSVFDCAFLYCESAIKLLGDWLQETEQERNDYTETQAEDFLLHLIVNEILRLTE